MCGLTGFWFFGGANGVRMERDVRRMTRAIAHRGPDDSGIWTDSDAGIALGHRRLSILDTSSCGHQPMTSPSGRYVMVYNGEAYNFAELRGTLEAGGVAPAWRGHSDTEILLAGFDHWGIPGTLKRTNGMFALAVWDRSERTLTLARDRLGEKPLFYGRMGQTFLFGSELRALMAHPSFERDLDRRSTASFLRHSYVPAPHSIWTGIAKLPPATMVTVSEGGRSVSEPQPYWSARAVVEHGVGDHQSARQMEDEIEALLSDAVGLRMVADVELGAFLSGGVDSSLITALMQAQSSRPIRTFTIGFDDPRFDEAPYANAVAAHLGTDHTALYIDEATMLDIVPKLPSIWDEPFADSSQIPTFLVSRLASSHVTVCLSGDGGDEIFGGYNRYLTGTEIANAARALPAGLRAPMAGVMGAQPTLALAESVNSWLPKRSRYMGLSDRIRKAADTVRDPEPLSMYRNLVSHQVDPDRMILGHREYPGLSDIALPVLTDPRAIMMYLDTVTYLPDDILTKVDRAGMAVGLEARVPFLDHRIVERAWSLPMEAKINGRTGKKILRTILAKYVPDALIERPKAGFSVPIAAWLKGPLREWAGDLLSPARIARQGIFDPALIESMLDDNASGRRALHSQLWDVLMFQAWHDCYGGASIPFGADDEG